MLTVAVLLVVVGIASAAVFTHYATLSGTAEVSPDISVGELPIGGIGNLEFIDGMATFNVNNIGNDTISVELVTTIFENDGTNYIEITDTEYLELLPVEYTAGTTIENGILCVGPGGDNVNVTFDPADNIDGTYKIQVEIIPYNEG